MAKPKMWEISRQDADGWRDEDEFRQEAVNLLAEIETIGHRTGGSFLVVPKRAEVAADVWVTIGWRVVWQSFAPAAQRAEEQRDPVHDFDLPDDPTLEPDEDPEPVVAS